MWLTSGRARREVAARARWIARIAAPHVAAFIAVLVSLLALPATMRAQDVPSDVTFNLRRDFLEELMTGGADARSVGARWTVRLRMDARSNVHPIGNDCELHVGARPLNNRKLANPAGVVVEPPNVCKRRLPGVATTGGISTAWQSYFDEHVIGRTCDVTGFPRIFSEHSEGGATSGGSNPNHVVEVHPATAMACGDQSLDFESILLYYSGMRHITPASATACISDRKLYVRGARINGKDVYEFAEEGAKGPGGRCGNFVIVDAHFTKDYMRQTTNGGDEIALAQVWIGESGPYSLKVYVYRNTPTGQRVAQLRQSADESEDLEITLHGMLTYDYFTIAQVVQRARDDGTYEWIPTAELKEWREVPRPLALVVFGKVP